MIRKNGERMSKAQSVWDDGWLVVLAYFSIFSWTRWISPNGFAGFYRRNGDEVKGRTNLQDGLHLTFAFLSVFLFSRLYDSNRAYQTAVLAIAGFKCVDLLLDFAMLAIFGNRYGQPWQGEMQARRLHRTLVIDLLLLVELVFWYATVAYVAAQLFPCKLKYEKPLAEPAHALHVSMATVTTIGYGTYAPVSLLAVLLSLVQALSALLLLTGVVAGIFSHISSQRGGPGANTADANRLPIPWNKGLGWKLRYVLPWLAPVVLITIVRSILIAWRGA
jgi:hypothetical protein